MVSVDVKGASDALDVILSLIIPWRREHAERRAKLENVRRLSEIQQLNAETLITQAKAEREKVATDLDSRQSEVAIAQAKKLEAEAALIFAQAEKTRIEAAKELAILHDSQVDLAIKIINKFAPNMSEDEKMSFVINQLTTVLNQLAVSEIQPTSIEFLEK